MSGISGYDEWKTTPPVDYEEILYCSFCGWEGPADEGCQCSCDYEERSGGEKPEGLRDGKPQQLLADAAPTGEVVLQRAQGCGPKS